MNCSQRLAFVPHGGPLDCGRSLSPYRSQTAPAYRARHDSSFVPAFTRNGPRTFRASLGAFRIPSPTRRDTVRMALTDVQPGSLTVLVVGSGGREHALVQSISTSSYLNKILAAPGNVGMSDICECVSSVSAEDVDAIVELAIERQVSLVVVGPEVPLVLGLVDRLADKGIYAFGPTKAAAQLEGSKLYCKCFLERHEIPTGIFAAFQDVEPAKACIRDMGAPIVVKASGLAAGKGVIIAKTIEEADAAVDDILVKRKFGNAGIEVVIEEFLTGEELSFFAIVDGETAVPLASAQDHKAAFDGDTGPNTGGMGAYSPAPLCDEAMNERIMTEVVYPTIKGMKSENAEFRGVLYCGMMVDKETGDLNVLEFNVRFGDPECQVLCQRLESDMLELLYRAATGQLGKDGFSLEWGAGSSMVVVLATDGYPGPYNKGSVIQNLDAANAMEGVTVYHAGTALSDDGELVANGGRVLGVTAAGNNILDAQKNAYAAVDVIDWPGGFCRRDIGWRAIERMQARAS